MQDTFWTICFLRKYCRRTNAVSFVTPHEEEHKTTQFRVEWNFLEQFISMVCPIMWRLLVLGRWDSDIETIDALLEARNTSSPVHCQPLNHSRNVHCLQDPAYGYANLATNSSGNFSFDLSIPQWPASTVCHAAANVYGAMGRRSSGSLFLHRLVWRW